jgi:hypothetical protein
LEPPAVLAFQIGEISSTTDLVELLRQLALKLEISLLKFSPVKGNCKFILTKGQDDTKLKLQYKDIAADEEVTVLLNARLELYLMSGLKFLFMMMGRAGYCGS